MEAVRPEFVPDPSLDREDMEALQLEIAETAVFADELPVDSERVCAGGLARWRDGPNDGDGDGTSEGDGDGSDCSDGSDNEDRHVGGSRDEPVVVAGVDQAFDGETAVSAIVVLADGDVVERTSAAVDTQIPYIPGLLSFREGNSILAAFRELSATPDVVLFDGSGRIHYRQAGLATHVGVTLDVPAVGVIKNLLCGTPRRSLDDPLPAGARVPIDPDEDVEGPAGGPIGYALQTRQFEGDRHVNPVFVSPGHRVGAETAADVVEQCGGGYKLPEPIRLADRYAAELTATDG